MRAIMLMLFAIGCGGDLEQQDNATCQNESREFWSVVPYAWDELEDIQTTKMTNGCILTTTTHYVYRGDTTTTSDNGGGNLPFGYYQQQCAFDACNPPLNITQLDRASDNR